jgi:hypothetical protein
LFEQQVLAKVVPLKLQVVPRSRFGTHGLQNLKFGFMPRVVAPTQLRDHRTGEVISETSVSNLPAVRERVKREGGGVTESHVWSVPFDTGRNTHFDGVNNYWAHTRVVDTQDTHIVVEVQSDQEQAKAGGLSEEERNILQEQLKNHQGAVTAFASAKSGEDLRTALINFSFLESVFNAEYPDGVVLNPELHNTPEVWVDKLLQTLDLKIAEFENKLAGSLQSGKMPKQWYELIIRHEMAEAAKAGQTKMRLPGLDTLSMLEWGAPVAVVEEQNKILKPGEYFIEELAGRKILTEDSIKYTGEVTVKSNGNVYANSNAPDGSRYDPTGVRGAPDDLIVRAAIPEVVDPQIATVIYKYRTEYLPFFNKEFGAKQITDEFGQVWWEADVAPELGERPIQYYNVDLSVGADVAELAKATNSEVIPRAFAHVQGLMNSILGLNQMAKALPAVAGLQQYRRLMQEMHNVKNALMAGPNEQLKKWHHVQIKQAELVEDALREQVRDGAHWASLEQDTAVDELGRTEVVWVLKPNAEFHQMMKNRGINSEGSKLFLGVVNDFLRVLGVMEKTLQQTIRRELQGNPLVMEARLRQVTDEFTQLRTIPYLPDTRFGNYSVMVRAGADEVVDGRQIKTGELVYWRKFESERERNKHYEEIKSKYGRAHQVTKWYEDDTVSALTAMPRAFVDTLVSVLNAVPETALTQEQMNIIAETQYDFTAAGKFEKYLRAGKKGVGGADPDLRRVYANYMWKTANMIAKMGFSKRLLNSIGEVRGEAHALQKAGGDPTPVLKLEEYLRKNFNYVMSPQNEWQQLRAFVSLWYLLGSPKTALMNFMSVPVLSYGYLASRYGDAGSVAALVRATKTVAQFWRDPEKVRPDLRHALFKARLDGVTDQSFAAMLANVAEGGVAIERLFQGDKLIKNRAAGDAARKLTWRILAGGMAPFRAVEQLNRMVTLAATYELEAAKLGVRGFSQEAYDAARDAVDYTQNEFSPWNRPEFMRGKRGVLLIFYSFVQNMAFMLFGGDKGWWRAMLVLAALAGLQGLPGIDNFLDIMNWVGRKYTGQHFDLRQDAREVAESLGANPDLVMRGLFHNMFGLGWDTSGSVGIGRIIPGTDAIFGIGDFEQRFLRAASEVGGPAGSLAINFLQALADDNPNSVLRFDKVLPPAIRNVERAFRAEAEGAWTDQRGNALVPDPTVVEVLGQALGFSPTRKTERQELLRAQRDSVVFYQMRRQELFAKAYDARHSGDTTAYQEVIEAIRDYNEGVPAPQLKITRADLANSLKARERYRKAVEAGDSPQKRYQVLYSNLAPLYPGIE